MYVCSMWLVLATPLISSAGASNFWIASFPGPHAVFGCTKERGVLQVTKSWAGPGNEANFGLVRALPMEVNRDMEKNSRSFFSYLDGLS